MHRPIYAVRLVDLLQALRRNARLPGRWYRPAGRNCCAPSARRDLDLDLVILIQEMLLTG